MRISIVGLGYVGLVSAGCLARDGHDVWGIDVASQKVDMINDGACPIVEEYLPELVAWAVQQKRFRATTDIEEGLNTAEVVFVCVGTPSLPNGAIDIRQIEKVASEIGRWLSHIDHRPIICLRSTVLPGTSEGSFLPIIAQASDKKSGVGFDFVYHPEFMRETTAVADYDKPGKIVFGSYKTQAAKICDSVYQKIDAPRFFVEPTVAELAKYTDNAFHALKITFANEIGLLASRLNIDSHKVMEMFMADRKLNISTRYLSPGFAFGGSCLPKDIKAIVHAAKTRDVEVPLLASLTASNELQKQAAFARIYELAPKKIGFIGIAFKKGTDDLRNSPIVDLVKQCRAEGIEHKILDNDVHPEKLLGKNKTALELNLPHFAEAIVRTFTELGDCDLLVVGHKQDDIAPLLAALEKGVRVFDLVRHEELLGNKNYCGVCW